MTRSERRVSRLFRDDPEYWKLEILLYHACMQDDYRYTCSLRLYQLSSPPLPESNISATYAVASSSLLPSCAIHHATASLTSRGIALDDPDIKM